jgi:phytoene/squalene synthetase/geranylgeranyl pyrophosphate synthase
VNTSVTERVRTELARIAEDAAARGMPPLTLDGQLIRPNIAYAVASRSMDAPPDAFWKAALAVQLAHEASLVHDDIIDTASTRRGLPTVAAEYGTAAAVLRGDHLLTAAYRLAAETGSIEFVSLFTRAVERTVAGEAKQSRTLGTSLSWDQYREIAEGKAGELLGCSLAIHAALSGNPIWERHAEVGRRIGLLYQMLDDLLDYCPGANTGKETLGDFAQKRWTWPLLELGDWSFDEDANAVRERLRRGYDDCALDRCLRRLEDDALDLRLALAEIVGSESPVAAVIDGWMSRARTAVSSERETRPVLRSSSPGKHLRARVPAGRDLIGYLATNSRSFRFASRFFPAPELESVARVYAYCRVTDDLVDRPGASDPAALLDEWMYFSRRSYDGMSSGLGLLDSAMGEMCERGVPFDYAASLADGMKMDLGGKRYANIGELRTYTYRVASVVGLWLTELAGVRDTAVLSRAAALGHAMQLTNILRDVGEDARAGRIYLPADKMKHHEITPELLEEMMLGLVPVVPYYAQLVEELLRVAERDYDFAFEAIPELPPSFQRPVAVAAYVYRGIHAEIRRRSYDNLTQRAVTSPGRKVILGTLALWNLRGAVSVPVRRPARA